MSTFDISFHNFNFKLCDLPHNLNDNIKYRQIGFFNEIFMLYKMFENKLIIDIFLISYILLLHITFVLHSYANLQSF